MDGINIPIKIHVARSEDILYTAVIGNDVFHFVHMTIGKDGARVKDKETQADDSEDNKDLDVSHLELDKANRIIDLIEQYSPKNQESFPVQMKIVLKDDTPLSHIPRSLPIADQVVVDNQADEWLRESIVKESLNKRDMPVRVWRWALCLKEFDYEIEYSSGIQMLLKKYRDLKVFIEEDVVSELTDKRTSERLGAKWNILILQENRKSFRRKRIAVRSYKIGDLRKLPIHGCYEVGKVGESEESNKTATVAEYMKSWPHCAV